METAKSGWNRGWEKKEERWERGGEEGWKRGGLAGAVVLLIGAFRRHSSRQIAGLDIMTKKADIRSLRCATDTLVKFRFTVKRVKIVVDRPCTFEYVFRP